MTSLNQTINALASSPALDTLREIQRGIERESLRVQPSGRLAQSDHPSALGSALTHPLITTDFSESLLELITAPSTSVNQTYQELADIHRYVAEHIGDELLWPMSMPCFISNQDDIRIAQYGKSNVAKMKSTYRVGLKHRYGSMMQAIAGIHYNFSLPNSFWQQRYEQFGQGEGLEAYRSAQYMKLVRNVKRYVWLVTYLFGASPAMCNSFLQGRKTELGFATLGKGTCYLPNATSLRMSDLGYTNNAQAALNIDYSSLEGYISGLRKAIRTPSERFSQIGVKVDGQYKQLNDNVLQIENELYAPVRPKQITQSGEKPTDALENRGVLYIELRALDVNPFAPYGITEQQMRVIECFLLFCLLTDDDELTPQQQREAEQNQAKMVLNGRADSLQLSFNGQPIERQDWLATMYDSLSAIAELLDKAYQSNDYQQSMQSFAAAFSDPNQTLSGKLLSQLLQTERDNGKVGLEFASTYKTQSLAKPYSAFSLTQLETMAAQSIEDQNAVEISDTLDFDTYLQHYFGE